MKEINYSDLLPDVGSITVLGRFIADPLLRALAYKVVEGYNIKLVPATPDQFSKAQKLNIPTVRGPPDYLFFEADYEPKEGVFTIGNCDSPMLVRIYQTIAEKEIVFLRKRYHTISVEYSSYLSDMIEPIISLYGEIVSRRESPLGNIVVDIIPYLDDTEEARRILREIPGVVEVTIIPTIPYRKIILR